MLNSVQSVTERSLISTSIHVMDEQKSFHVDMHRTCKRTKINQINRFTCMKIREDCEGESASLLPDSLIITRNLSLAEAYLVYNCM